MTDQPWVAPGSERPHQPGQSPASGYPPAPAPAPAPTQPPGPWQPPSSATPPAYQVPPPAPAPGYRPPVMEFRPGVIPLRPLTLGDIYGAVVKTIRGNVAATMGLALITTLVFLVPTTALGAWVASFESTDYDPNATGGEALPLVGTIAQYIPSFGTWLSTVLLTGIVAWVVGQAVMGRRVSAGQTWDGVRGRLPQVIGATLLTTALYTVAFLVIAALPAVAIVNAIQSKDDASIGIAIGAGLLGLLVLVVVMFFLTTRLAFVTAVVVLERTGVVEAFRRSWRLTGGSQFWRIFGIRLLTSFIVGLAAQVVAVPLGILTVVLAAGVGDLSRFYIWQAVITGVTGLITGALTTPFTAGVDSLLYVDQRIRREGFDVQLVTAAQQSGAGSPTTGPTVR